MNNTGADLAGQITTFPGAKLARVSPELARGLGHSPRGRGRRCRSRGADRVVAFSRKAVTVSAVAGFGLLLAIWVIGQDFGQIYSGQATDPNTGVIAIVVAVGLLPLRRGRARREFDEGAC